MVSIESLNESSNVKPEIDIIDDKIINEIKNIRIEIKYL